MVKSSSVSAPPRVIDLEWTTGSATWRGTTSVDIIVDGYIRDEYLEAQLIELISRGYILFQADGELVAKLALVIDVKGVTSSLSQGQSPRTFHAINNFAAPANGEVVICGLEPGPDVNTPPPVLGRMRRTRIRVQ
jgi:hypothetical protein